MPELPEVTTVIGILKPLVVGKTIESVDILYKRMILSGADNFEKGLLKKKFLDITRLGKFLIFHLSDNVVLISHLRMEGKYAFCSENDPNPKFTNVVFHLNDAEKLVYFDTRKFGIMILTDEEHYLKEEPLSKLGPEPMSVNKDNIKSVYKGLSRKKPIKELITDQSVLAGIGNIYADEILYFCKINPLTLGSDLTEENYNQIISFAAKILNEAIKLGGSTIKSYHPKEGVDGQFQILLKAYGHEGDKCERCGTRFHKIFLNGRGTTFCPNCQIDYSLKKAIGITGPIGSGKSTISKIFAEHGYFVVDCDRIVHDLYKEESTQKLLIKNFGKQIIKDEKINYALLREIITKNLEKQELLENLIHPLVEEKLIDLVKSHDNIVIEVQLLFKAHLQYLFKKIIYVSSKDDEILKRLEDRGYKNTKEALNVYYRENSLTSNNDIIPIENNSSIEELNSKVEQIIHEL